MFLTVIINLVVSSMLEPGLSHSLHHSLKDSVGKQTYDKLKHIYQIRGSKRSHELYICWSSLSPRVNFIFFFLYALLVARFLQSMGLA